MVDGPIYDRVTDCRVELIVMTARKYLGVQFLDFRIEIEFSGLSTDEEPKIAGKRRVGFGIAFEASDAHTFKQGLPLARIRGNNQRARLLEAATLSLQSIQAVQRIRIISTFVMAPDVHTNDIALQLDYTWSQIF